jgi:hypothetical protein
MNQELKEIKTDLDAISERLTILAEEEKEKDEKIKPSHIPGYYEPEVQECYHYPAIGYPDTNIKYWQNDNIDHHYQRFAMCCKTEAEAVFVMEQRDAYRTLVMRIKELNAGWVPDWGSMDQDKYHFYLYLGDLGVFFATANHVLPDELYLKTREIGNQLIIELGEDLIKLALWGIQ